MTKVLRKATAYKITCGHCLSDVSFDLGAISEEKSMNEEKLLNGYIRCPNCDEYITVTDERLNMLHSVSPIYGEE